MPSELSKKSTSKASTSSGTRAAKRTTLVSRVRTVKNATGKLNTRAPKRTTVSKPKTVTPEDRFRKLVENMNEALWLGDKDERTLYANPKFRRLMGYNLKEMMGRESYDFWTKESAKLVRKINMTDRKQGISSTYEGDLQTRTGEMIPVLLSGTPLPDGGTMGIMTDLREIRKKEMRLKDSEKRYRTVVENMGEALLLEDENRRITYVNSQFEKLLGYTAKEAVGRDAQDFWLKDDLYILERENKKRKKGLSSVYECNLLHKRGFAVPVRVSGTPMLDGGTMAIMMNLTEDKRKEERLGQMHEYERYLAAVTESSADGVVGLDMKRKIKSWNQGAENIFGFKREEIIGKSILVFYPANKLEEGEFQKLRREVAKHGFVRNYRTVRLNKDQKPVEVALTDTAIRDEEGKLIGFSVIYRDMSLQKKWEEELKGEFDRLQDAYRELGKKGRQLDFFEDLLDMAVGNLEVTSFEEFVVSAAGLITKADGCVLRLVNRKKRTLELKAIYGLSQEWWGKK